MSVDFGDEQSAIGDDHAGESALELGFPGGTELGRHGLRTRTTASSVVAIGPNLGMETNRAVRSSKFYGSFEVTPVFFGEDLRAYMSSDSDLYTNAGVMMKVHVGVFLR